MLGYQLLWGVTVVPALLLYKKYYRRDLKAVKANYLMSCFLLPNQFCDELNRLIAHFWWSNTEAHQKIHQISQDKLCFLKSKASLGFTNFYAFNHALLAKQAWQMITNPDSLLARVLTTKYFPSSSFMDAQVKANFSFCWRSICAARDIIWHDPQISLPSFFQIFTPKLNGCTLEQVMELIRHDMKVWKSDLLTSLFNDMEMNLILSIPLSIRDTSNCLTWHYEANGVFFVKITHYVARDWLFPITNRASSSFSVCQSSIWSKL